MKIVLNSEEIRAALIRYINSYADTAVEEDGVEDIHIDGALLNGKMHCEVIVSED